MKKIRTVAVGAATGLALASVGTVGAADLGVLTTLDVCDELGLAGLTISSDTNCLTVSGEVEYEFVWGDYDEDREVADDLAYSGGYDVFIGDGATDWESSVTVTLTFEGTASTDVGPGRGVITIEGTDEVSIEDGVLDDETHEVVLDEAYVAIGEDTVIMAGLKDTIVEDGDDTSFTYQEMFNEDEASGVGYNSDATGTDIDDEGHVIQVVTDLGSGLTIGAALEDLDDRGTLVGVVQYAGDDFEGHVTVLADEVLEGVVNDWAVHAAATLSIDTIRVRGAAAFNNDGWWNVLGTADVGLDMFTLAVGAEATSEDEYGFAGSAEIEVTDGVVLNVGSRAFIESDDDVTVDTVAEVEYEATETITLIAGSGYIYESDDPNGLTYGRLSLEWAPGDELETELTGRVHSRPGDDLGYELSLTATKTFE